MVQNAVSLSVLQGWAQEGIIKTVEQWTEKIAKGRDKPNRSDKTAAKLDKYEWAKLKAFKMLDEQGVVFDDEDTS